MDIYEKIAGVLVALGYTKEDLIERLDINPHRAKALLAGSVKRMRFKEFCDICMMLNVDPNFFFSERGVTV